MGFIRIIGQSLQKNGNWSILERVNPFIGVLTVELRFGEVSARLSAKWQSLEDDVKKNYPINGKNTPPQSSEKNLLLDQSEIHKRNRQKLWNSMKNQVCKQ